MTLASNLLIFSGSSAENTTRCASILTTEDNESEGDETFIAVLTTQDPDIMLGNSVTTVTIVDDDGEL